MGDDDGSQFHTNATFGFGSRPPLWIKLVLHSRGSRLGHIHLRWDQDRDELRVDRRAWDFEARRVLKATPSGAKETEPTFPRS